MRLSWWFSTEKDEGGLNIFSRFVYYSVCDNPDDAPNESRWETTLSPKLYPLENVVKSFFTVQRYFYIIFFISHFLLCFVFC